MPDATLITSQRVYEGRIFDVTVDRVRLPHGRDATLEVVRHDGSDVLIPGTEEGKLLLVRQYRHPSGEILLELPAGTLDMIGDGSTEDPLVAGKRELFEETGHRAESWTKIGEFFTAPGFASELMHLYLATDLATAHPEGRLGPDEDERLIVSWMPGPDAVAAAERGDIRDAKSIVGLFWLARLRATADATAAAERA